MKCNTNTVETVHASIYLSPNDGFKLPLVIIENQYQSRCVPETNSHIICLQFDKKD